MTGFAEAMAERGEHSVRVAIRAVNHRSLDLKVRVPSSAARLESGMRRDLRGRVRRGSLQVTLEVQSCSPLAAEVDRELVVARLAAFREVAELLGAHAVPDPQAMLGLPGTVVTGRAAMPDETLEALVGEALDLTLERLDRVREQEGQALVADIREHADAIGAEVGRLRLSAREAVDLYHAKVQDRLAEVLGGQGVDSQRLAQEVAILAGRSDFSEELARLRAHVEQLRGHLEDGGEVGKRIDFLAQEMNREANTLLAKAQVLGEPGLWVTEAALRIRSAVEKIREQAPNLE